MRRVYIYEDFICLLIFQIFFLYKIETNMYKDRNGSIFFGGSGKANVYLVLDRVRVFNRVKMTYLGQNLGDDLSVG